MTTRKHSWHWLAALALTLGCGQGGNGYDVDPSALEQEMGGLTEADEAPAFGEAETFAELSNVVPDAEFADPVPDTDIQAAERLPGARSIVVTLVWGRAIPRPAPVLPWGGTLTIDRGALRVLRTIRFDRGDFIVPRTDPRAVAWRSRTAGHLDGIQVRVVGPPDATLRFATEPTNQEWRLSELAGLHRIYPAGDEHLAVLSLPVSIDGCPQGLLAGRWRLARPALGLGIFHGRWVNALGEQRGHVRGFYGRNRAGAHLLFGKVIDADGRFIGLLAGTYGEGRFEGRWIVRRADRGTLGGIYVEAPGPGGFFAGRWAETCPR
jgi:hypothetical protein